MQNFTFFSPTKVVFGKDTEKTVGKLVRSFGGNKVLVHFGGQSANKSGLLDRVYSALKEENLPYVSLGGVVPNPRLSKIYEGIELCKAEGVDFILAVGGGSVIDSAKGIAYGLVHDFDVWKLFTGEKKASGIAPVGSVVTIAAAGSETSYSSVITKEEGLLKRTYNDDIAKPKFAVMNPELTYSLPEYQTMSGCVDIMMHTLERYFTSDPDTMALTDRFSESLFKTCIESSHTLLDNPTDYKARAELMWAGSLSHNGLMNCGGPGGDWACHRLEHELSALYDVAHGAGLSAIWSSWARYVYRSRPERFAQLAETVFDITAGSIEEQALMGIEAMETFFRSIHMPVTITELLGRRIPQEDVNLLAEKCAAGNPKLGNIRELFKADMVRIYELAL